MTRSTGACRRSQSPMVWSTRPTCPAGSIALMRRRDIVTGFMTANPISGLPPWSWTERSSSGPAKVCAVLAAGRYPKVLATVRLGSAIRAMPVAADGTLFVASQRYLWAVEDSQRNHSSALATTTAPAAPSDGHPIRIAATAIRETLAVIGRQSQLSETDFNLQAPMEAVMPKQSPSQRQEFCRFRGPGFPSSCSCVSGGCVIKSGSLGWRCWWGSLRDSGQFCFMRPRGASSIMHSVNWPGIILRCGPRARSMPPGLLPGINPSVPGSCSSFPRSAAS